MIVRKLHYIILISLFIAFDFENVHMINKIKIEYRWEQFVSKEDYIIISPVDQLLLFQSINIL